MASFNQIILIGNLGRDPEVKYTQGGQAVCNFSVAVNEQWTDKSGEKQEKTEWHRVVFFGRLAEIAGEYLKKGSQIYIEGRLQTRKWQDKEGHDRYTTEIVANDMQMLGSRSGQGAPSESFNQDQPQPQAEAAPSGNQAAKAGGKGAADFDDDIPF